MSGRPNKVLPAAEAARMWSLYGFESPKELVLEDLAMALGIIVTDGPLDSAAARLLRSGDSGLVRVSDRIREPGRRRFTIAHEIGHWLLHEHQSQLLACTDEDLLASYHSSPLEVEASIFAGALLMPEHLFAARIDGARPTTRTIKALCDFFDTTLTATSLRFVDISTDYCVFVLSEKNRIRWWRASASFGDHELWLDNRSPLHPNSIAAAFFRGQAMPTAPQRVDLRDWLGDMPGIDSQTIIEQAIPLPAYQQVISLLWLP
jgi:Zn-dependent peptidase ImmA (M78 family)